MMTPRPDTRPRVLASTCRRALTCAASLACAVGPLAGCSADGPARPQPQSATERAKSTPILLDDYAKLGYRLEWRGFPTMLPGEHITQFEIFDDIVVAQESAGVVSVLESRSGTARWSDQVAGRLTKFVGILRNDDRLLVSSESEIYFYDIATGTLKNKQQLQQVVNTRPARVGDILVYGCANGQVLGHLLLNGFRAWATGLGGSIATDPILTSSGRVALCSTTGELVILDGLSGLSQGRAKMFSGPGASIASSDTALYIASTDHSLYAYSSEGAVPFWRKRTSQPLRQKPTYHDGRVYCDMGEAEPNDARASARIKTPTVEVMGGLTCFDSANGKVLWSNPKVSGVLIGLRNKRLVVWNAADSTVYTLQPADGVIVEAVKLPGVTMLKPDAFTDGNLYAVSTTGLVSKLAPK
ncbi:MAG TPA: PQQ-binding-like beta-propeller repeat protein [Phycisphaerales bacterium]|nr:PQQ-binding-like beta-propeller repeat protein [Phycisphaerales bacterium]